MHSNIRLGPALALLLAGCGTVGEPSTDETLSAAIEKQVVAEHPDLDLKRYARFYSRETGDYVRGTYLFANEGYEPPAGKTGQIYWVAPKQVPLVMDGGCAVITVRYHTVSHTLVSLDCNGDA